MKDQKAVSHIVHHVDLPRELPNSVNSDKTLYAICNSREQWLALAKRGEKYYWSFYRSHDDMDKDIRVGTGSGDEEAVTRRIHLFVNCWGSTV